ncbi:MAG: hypothetical protein K2G36_11515 [Ruminococcus sp.]|nr:hypothetical protein [Ruminococcus sp.]
MKKYIFLLAVLFLVGCASKNNTELPTTTQSQSNYIAYSVTENKVNLKLNKKIVQTLEFDHNINKDDISAEDFDFDGYTDICIPTFYDMRLYSYYRYNPDTEQFEEWDELNKIDNILEVNPDNTLTEYSSYLNDYTTYRWNDDILEPIKLLKCYSTHEGDIEDLYEYQPDGSKILIERTIINPENNTHCKITNCNEVIYFEVTENSVNVMRNGKIIQSIENKTLYKTCGSLGLYIAPETFINNSDFDFDGYNDLYIPNLDEWNEFHGTYYRYNPDMEQFEEWDELNKIGKLFTVGMSQNVRIGQILSLDTEDGQTFIYKWNGDSLNLVERCETDTDNNKIWYYIDENGNEFLCEY